MPAVKRNFSSNKSKPKGDSMDFDKIKKIALLVGGVVALLLLVSVGRGLVETNNAGYFQVKQTVGTGAMSVINNPGMYLKLFATVTTYQVSDMHYFSANDKEGERTIESDPIKVRFNDGGTAEVSGSIKYRLPTIEAAQLRLHQDYKSYAAVRHDLIRQVVAEAVMQTANLMKAEESYTTRRSEFAALAEEQVKQGLFETASKEYKDADADGNQFIERDVTIKIDKNGLPVVRKVSPFHQYGIEVIQFTIKDINYDKTIDDLIGKKKEAEQQKIVARANAERAKQDAITAREQGNARIATEKANQDVEKIKEVTIAQKEFEVSQLRRKQAEQDAAAQVTTGKALADVNRLKVAAGLTPLERATIAKETAIGVAAELAKVRFPEMMVIGGGGGGKAADPFEAVGLESLMRISDKMSRTKSSKEE
jgi:regulator of protease activity HflC (stomatin/prohibitin superfamily)